MDAGLWVAQGLLAVMFLMVGTAKVTKSKEELADRLDWVEDFSEGTIKFIGNVALIALALFVAWGRFGDYPL